MPAPATASAIPDRLERHARRFGGVPLELLRALARAEAALESAQGDPRVRLAGVDAAELARLRAALEALAALDRSVGRVGAAFRLADRATVARDGRVRTSEAELARASALLRRGGRSVPVTVLRPGAEGRTAVAQVHLDDLIGRSGPVAWDEALTRMGVGAEAVHLVVHGWGTDSRSAVRAGEATADLADGMGIGGGTVLVIDWPAGEGTRGPLLEVPADFAAARRSTPQVARRVVGLLAALARRGVDVSIAAHSLGVDVVARALTLLDPAVELTVDLLAIQAAAPSDDVVHDPAYAALVGPRVGRLTLTVDHRDASLGLYELVGPEAMGDERPDSALVEELVATRRARGLGTEVIDHHDPDGRGHLHLSPSPRHPRVRELTADQLQRAAGSH